MRILYTSSLLFLIALGCAKTPLINEQDFHSNYYQQIVQSTLENYIKKRLNKKRHPQKNTVIYLYKNNKIMEDFYEAIEEPYTLKREDLQWTDQYIEGYKVQQTEPENENDLIVTIIISDLYTENDSPAPTDLLLYYRVYSQPIFYPKHYIDVYHVNMDKVTFKKTLPLVIAY